jgi:hypothetical protein
MVSSRQVVEPLREYYELTKSPGVIGEIVEYEAEHWLKRRAIGGAVIGI